MTEESDAPTGARWNRRWPERAGWALTGAVVTAIALSIYGSMHAGVSRSWHPPGEIDDPQVQACSVFLRRPLPSLALLGWDDAEMWVGPTADRGTVISVSDDHLDDIKVTWDATGAMITESTGVRHHVAARICPDQ